MRLDEQACAPAASGARASGGQRIALAAALAVAGAGSCTLCVAIEDRRKSVAAH